MQPAAHGRVYAFPGAPAPVQNPARRGRYPSGVVGLQAYRRQKLIEAAPPRQQAAPLPEDEGEPFMGHLIGARLVDIRGNAVVVMASFGRYLMTEHDTGEVHYRRGYLCKMIETGKRFFYPAWTLFNADGDVTHLRLATGGRDKP
ncbi:MAG TPA: hypothetical protein VF522_18950 [Ramlibacter sp.]|uniref:hypothetical protein n=1 Tax=Ramlibacter sp. TaxID=1917967 RepID=UPI002ED2E242